MLFEEEDQRYTVKTEATIKPTIPPHVSEGGKREGLGKQLFPIPKHPESDHYGKATQKSPAWKKKGKI